MESMFKILNKKLELQIKVKISGIRWQNRLTLFHKKIKILELYKEK